MSDQNDSFFREVEDEYRRDRMAKLFDKYGIYALVIGAALVLGVGGYQWYQAVQIDSAQKAGGRFAAAQRLLESDEAKQAETAVQDFQTLAKQGVAPYETLARLQLAGRHLAEGRTDEAKAAFTTVADSAEAAETLRSYATLQLIALEADTLDWTAFKTQITPYMSDESAWRHTAREIYAAQAVKSGQNEEAQQVLSKLLSDTDAPSSVRQRAEMLMGLATSKTMQPDRSDAETSGPATPGAEGSSSEPNKSKSGKSESSESAPGSPATVNSDSKTSTADTKKPNQSGSSLRADQDGVEKTDVDKDAQAPSESSSVSGNETATTQ